MCVLSLLQHQGDSEENKHCYSYVRPFYLWIQASFSSSDDPFSEHVTHESRSLAPQLSI